MKSLAKNGVNALGILVLLAHSHVALAQKSYGSWEPVSGLPVGAKVAVKSKAGKTLEGNVTLISESHLAIYRKGQTIEFARTDIARVYRVVSRSRGKSTGRNALIGAAIGFGAGAGTGAIVSADPNNDLLRGETIALLGVIGAITGAVTGAISGLISPGDRRTLIYRVE